MFQREFDTRSRSRSPMSDDDAVNVEQAATLNSQGNRNGKRKPKRRNRNKNIPFSNKGNLSNRTADCTAFVSNLPYEFKKKELRDLFDSVVGNVTYVEVFNNEQGKPRGCAIVDFENEDLAKEAIEKMHHMEVKSRKIIVRSRKDVHKSGDFKFYFSQEWKGKNKGGGGKSGGGGGGRGRGAGGGRAIALMDINPYAQSMGGGYNMGLNSLAGTFNTGGGAYGGSLNLGGGLMGGGSGGLMGGGGGGSMGGASNNMGQDSSTNWKYGNTYGLPVSFLEALGIEGPIGASVFVARLDHKVTDEDLREAFQIAGTVVEAEIMKDSEGKSRGFGTVEFEHPLQAVQAISMLNNQHYFDRKIAVHMDKFNNQKIKAIPIKLPKGLKGVGCGLGSDGKAVTELSELSDLQRNLSTKGIGALNLGSNITGNTSNYGPGINPALLSAMGNMENSGAGGFNMNAGLGALASVLNSMNGSGFDMDTLAMLAGNNNLQQSQDFNSDFDDSPCAVKITQLPLDFSWSQLKQLCGRYGEVRFAEIKKKGVGIVRFFSPAEAQRTVDMLDKQMFDGRVLSATLI